MRTLKRALDPGNRMNPGKMMATSTDGRETTPDGDLRLHGLPKVVVLVTSGVRAGELSDDLHARRARVMATRLGADAMLVLWSAPARRYFRLRSISTMNTGAGIAICIILDRPDPGRDDPPWC